MTYLVITDDNNHSYNICNLGMEELTAVSKATNLRIINNSFVSFRKEDLSKYNKMLNRGGYVCKIQHISRL